MTLSKQQKNELETLAYFGECDDFTPEEIDTYFKWSEKGIGNGGRLSVLKQKRGIMMGEYEKGILEGSTPYVTLLDPLPPRSVIEFMKRELFKGHDAELIESIYALRPSKEIPLA